MTTPKFTRMKEDFVCDHCSVIVKGTGYTNHCPTCLWSKHVDVNPGDRAAECGGMMRPIRVEVEGDSYVLTHRCEVCGYEKRNKAAKEDRFGEIVKLVERPT